MEVVYNGKDAYRTFYSMKIGRKIYVLHCFQKKSPRGKEMPRPDMETLKARIKRAVELANKDEGNDEG